MVPDVARVAAIDDALTARSVEGRLIRALAFGRAFEPSLAAPGTVLVHGGIHGDEPGAAAAVEELAARLARRPPIGRIVVVPAANPDGLAAGTKDNARGVDLNRNFPSRSYLPNVPGAFRSGYDPGASPLCEPESAFLARLVERERPACLVAVHQPFACVNYDGPARALAERISAACGWPVREDLGYPTPGSFGACYGVDRGLPVITLELPRVLSAADADAALAALACACGLAPFSP